MSAFVDPESTYILTEISGEPFTATASISFPEKGSIRGVGPCNSFNAKQSAPYPWLEVGPVRSTMKSCPENAAERSYFQTLAQMNSIEVAGDVLVLRGDDDQEMVFRLHQP